MNSVSTWLKKIISGDNKTLALFILVFNAVIFCLLESPYSPMRLLIGHCDYACFFMAGKAWYYGLLPYVDFADVKGPLLFLIFRIGYSLSPGSTTGTFIVMAGLLFISLFFISKTTSLYVKQPLVCAIGALLVLQMRVLSDVDLFGRAEDVVSPFIACVLYFGARYFKNPGKSSSLRFFAWSLGICCGAVLLIKYNICLFFFIIACYTATYLLIQREWSKLACFCLHGMLAFVAIILPFVIYMVSLGIFDDFIATYFILNIETYQNMKALGAAHILERSCLNLARNPYIIIAAIALLSMLFTVGKQSLFTRKEIAFFLSVTFAVSCAGYGVVPYYMAIGSAAVFPIIVIFCYRAELVSAFHVLAAAGISMIFPFLSAAYDVSSRGVVYNILHRVVPTNESSIDTALSACPRAKILYLNCVDAGYGVASQCLPAIPMWTTFNGLEDALKQERHKAVEKQLADYIIIIRPKNPGIEDFLAKNNYSMVAKEDLIVGFEHQSATYQLWKKN